MIQDIPFRNIPHQSALFLKYLEFSPDAMRFYQHAPTMESLERLAVGGFPSMTFPRKDIASILRRQNTLFGAGTAVMQQIDELEKPDSVAIVTGQQVGLFTGPIYTIYKALTAVRIARELQKRGIRAVPIFWMETEDHDFQEATHRTVLDSETSAKVADFGKALFHESDIALHSVGSLRFPESIKNATEDFLRYLPESRENPLVRALLESSYAPGATFALAFARLLQQILSGFGLVCFDPSDAESKRLVSPIYQRALQDSDTFLSALLQRNRELQSAGFHTQVSILENSTVVFFKPQEERRVLEQCPQGFRLKNSDCEFTREELQECAQKTPEKFSPSVLLRPIIQDHLFPTIAYVGGAAEIAYFAQIETLYSLFQRPMPVIWPRNGFTLIDAETASEMGRLNIDFKDCFLERTDLMEKVLHQSGFSKTTENLNHLQEHLDQELSKIRPDLEAIEARLAPMLDKAQRKILHNVHYLKSRVVRLETTQNASIAHRIDSILNQGRPNGNLQERELTILYFLAEHGLSVLKAIYSETEINNFAHRVLQLENM
jgi:bacillithiol synthase